MSKWRQLVLDGNAQCASCQSQLIAGDLVVVEEPGGSPTCIACFGEPTPEYDGGLKPGDGFSAGTPGGSALREYERRRDRELQIAKERRGVKVVFVALAAVGGYVAVSVFAAVVNRALRTNSTKSVHEILPPSSVGQFGLVFAAMAAVAMARALWGRRQSTESWSVGSRGERAEAAHLAALNGEGIVVIHDCRIPGSKANIDHIAVSSSGVYVIDAKVTKGAVSARTTGPIWNRGSGKLYFGGRDRSAVLEGMNHQVNVVSGALGNEMLDEVPIHPMVVVVGAEWKWLAKPLRVRGVWVGWPKAMVKFVDREGPISPAMIRRLATTLAVNLPGA